MAVEEVERLQCAGGNHLERRVSSREACEDAWHLDSKAVAVQQAFEGSDDILHHFGRRKDAASWWASPEQY